MKSKRLKNWQAKQDYCNSNVVYNTTFQHIHFSNGFAVSDEIMGKGKGFTPKSTHGCLQSGYWCELQVKEDGLKGIISWLKAHKIRNPKTVIKAIKKYE